jgi:hypothetical protein
VSPALPPEDDDTSAAAAARRTLMKGLTPYTLSDAAFARVEAGLVEAAQARQRRGWLAWAFSLSLGAAVAAAVLLALRPAPKPVELPAQVAVAPQRSVFPALTAVQVHGEVKARTGPDAPWADVVPGAELRAGAALAATEGQVSWVAAGAALRVSAALAVRPDGQVLLSAGAVAADLALAQPVVVESGERFLRARDALFTVERAGSTLRLAVYRGTVDLGSEATFRDARALAAPAELVLEDGAKLAAAGVTAPAVGAPVLYAPAPPYGTLTLEASKELLGAPLSLDGMSVGRAPLKLFATRGPHTVGWQLPNGSLQTVQLVASDTPAFVLVEGPRPAPRLSKELSSEEVRARVGAVSRRLSSCADKWVTLEGAAGGGGEMVAAVRIGASGKVAKVTVRGEGREVPATVRDCVTSVLGRLVFSTADEPTEVELPIRVTAHGH